MLFNSISFLIFLPIVFFLYWFVCNRHLKLQNWLLLISSYIFYGWWDYRFLALIFLSTLIDYLTGLKIENSKNQIIKKRWLFLSIFSNLGMLGFFKYYNFFITSWIEAFQSIGYSVNPWTLNIILPVGISFYTFQTMSYSLDIYKSQLRPTSDFVSFAAFVSFFPQLVAGPIERASQLLPQILNKRIFKYEQAVDGLKLILWGMFKKVVIADNLSSFVDSVFIPGSALSGLAHIVGVLCFALQIYCDFSGYTDIAIGVSRLFGISLMNNFNFPYFSKSISEFWRKWHISLTTWFRDYLYIPLGGSRNGLLRSILNVWIVFLVSGLWHGANWTFVFWGALHAAFFIPGFIKKRTVKKPLYNFNKGYIVLKIINWLSTMVIVCFAWIFFRSPTIMDAFSYISKIDFSNSGEFQLIIKYIFYFILFELLIYKGIYWKVDNKYYKVIQYCIYIFFLLSIIANSTRQGSDFIYFQF